MNDVPRAVVTGFGAVTPMGRGADALWEGLVAGRVSAREVTLFDPTPFRTKLAGQVDGYDPGEEPRALRFALDAAREALTHATFTPGNMDPQRVQIILGTNFGAVTAAENALADATASPDLTRYAFGSQAETLARRTGLEGVRSVLSLSCASGAATVALAALAIRQGKADVVLAIGYDELSLFAFAGLSALRAMTKTSLRPFDVERNGTLFGEGAGALVVESEPHARRRSAQPLATIAGFALNNDAYHMTAPEPEARGIVALIHAALHEARMSPDSVRHINVHGTATRYNDLIETRAIKTVFGSRAQSIPVTANKGALTHLMGAAGCAETIAAIQSMNRGVIPPIAGLQTPDPELDLDLVYPAARHDMDLPVVLKTSYGIGGTNACLVLTRP